MSAALVGALGLLLASWTASSASAAELSPTEMKYRLREIFGDRVLSCGPAVGVAGLAADERARRFQAVRKRTEEFQSILRHESLADTGAWGEREQLTVLREHYALAAIRLEPRDGEYAFRLRVARNGLESGPPGRPAEARPHLATNALLVEGVIDRQGVVRSVRRQAILHRCPR